MNSHPVDIEARFAQRVVIRANSQDEAYKIAESLYKNGEIDITCEEPYYDEIEVLNAKASRTDLEDYDIRSLKMEEKL